LAYLVLHPEISQIENYSNFEQVQKKILAKGQRIKEFLAKVVTELSEIWSWESEIRKKNYPGSLIQRS
jgi:hypothetical protein